jgi:hypothetical protein
MWSSKPQIRDWFNSVSFLSNFSPPCRLIMGHLHSFHHLQPISVSYSRFMMPHLPSDRYQIVAKIPLEASQFAIRLHVSRPSNIIFDKIKSLPGNSNLRESFISHQSIHIRRKAQFYVFLYSWGWETRSSPIHRTALLLSIRGIDQTLTILDIKWSASWCCFKPRRWFHCQRKLQLCNFIPATYSDCSCFWWWLGESGCYGDQYRGTRFWQCWPGWFRLLDAEY